MKIKGLFELRKKRISRVNIFDQLYSVATLSQSKQIIKNFKKNYFQSLTPLSLSIFFFLCESRGSWKGFSKERGRMSEMG